MATVMATGDGDGDGDGDAGRMLTKEQCLDMANKTVASDKCLECTCAADPTATAECGEVCWNLIVCITDACDGDFTDGDCLNTKCGNVVANAEREGLASMTMILGPAYAACGLICTGGDRMDGGPDEDAGD